jgi:hypothetical protein
MFRKLTDRLTSAASAASAAVGFEDSKVRALTSMGFAQTKAQNALQATNGDVDRAAELLLLASGTQRAPIDVDAVSGREDDDAAMRRVMEESVRVEEQRRRNEASRMRSAAAVRAGEAASLRATRKKPIKATGTASLAVTHPAVKVTPSLQDKTKEEQILRCADRLKTFPSAVDTLHRALATIQKNPDNATFRSIDKNHPGYQRSVASATGAEDFIAAMNFTQQKGNTRFVLERHMVDPALLYLGISALEQTKLTPEYKEAKQKAAFVKALQQIQLEADSNTQEAIARAGFISKCPTEPAEGRGAIMSVVMGDQTVRRRFDGDDTLTDVLNWLGGHGSSIRSHILSREWSLVDKNKYPLHPIDCEKHQRHTLQYIGCWPSGLLEIMPSRDEWAANGAAVEGSQGPTRGLGTFSP